ncbi:MAG TPA: ATP-grasp domain-containing protein [Candidatus Woesebacteria bacterium]|nr:ATP-grasp domain-containing protein [Candidatus Woesebacteria bacterium]
MNLLSYLSSLPYNFVYLCLDQFLDINLPQLPNFYSISPITLKINLSLKNTGVFIENQKTIDYLQNLANSTNKKNIIIPFKPSGKIEKICQKYQWIYAANSSKLNRFFEDKIKFPTICSLKNIPIIPHLITTFTSDNINQAFEKFQTPLVIQSHFGWAGNSTFFLKNFQPLLPDNTPIKISPYLSGYTLLNNCCLVDSHLFQSPPALQFTGIKKLTDNPFTTVGRQWPANISSSIKSQVLEITNSFGEILKENHYRGFFGLDFFVNQNKVYLLECNPRLTASFSFYTQLEIQASLNPLFYFHLLSFIPHNFNISDQQENQRFNQELIGAQLNLKNKQQTTIYQYNFDHQLVDQPENFQEIPEVYINKLLNDHKQ